MAIELDVRGFTGRWASKNTAGLALTVNTADVVRAAVTVGVRAGKRWLSVRASSQSTNASNRSDFPPAGTPAGENVRNGSIPKTVQTDVGPVRIETPRDRDGSFEPVLVAKRQRRLAGLDEKILALYAGGMTVPRVVDRCSPAEDLAGARSG